MADLDHTLEADQLAFVHFVAAEQFGIVAKVAQEPVQLPQGFRVAVEAAGNDVVGESAGLKNGKAKGVVRLLCLPPKVDHCDADQEDPVGDLVGSAAIGGVQTGDLAFHAAPAFWSR